MHLVGFAVEAHAGETYRRLAATFQLKDFFRQPQLRQGQRRAPIAYPTPNTQCHSVEHLVEDAADSVTAEEGVVSLPVEVRHLRKLHKSYS